MTFQAGWRTHVPGDINAGKTMTVATPDDVDKLIEALSDDDAAEAHIDHTTPTPTHTLLAGVSDGYGYLAYAGADGYLMSAGDPASPVYGENADFDAGSGIPINDLTTALKEYVQTGRRPTNVEWRDAE